MIGMRLHRTVIAAMLAMSCAEKINLDVRDGAASDTSDTPLADAVVRPATCGEGMGPCNPVNNSGCYANERCFIRVGSSPTRCGSAGTGGWGAPCVDESDCGAGFVCQRPSASGGSARCMKLCCLGDDDSCRDTAAGGLRGGVCTVTLPDGLHGCEVPCDPFSTSNSCPTDAPYCGPDMTGSFRCAAQSTTPPRSVGESCTASNQCRPGSVCSPANDRCTPACNPNIATDSCLPRHCVPVPQYPNFGYCN